MVFRRVSSGLFSFPKSLFSFLLNLFSCKFCFPSYCVKCFLSMTTKMIKMYQSFAGFMPLPLGIQNTLQHWRSNFRKGVISQIIIPQALTMYFKTRITMFHFQLSKTCWISFSTCLYTGSCIFWNMPTSHKLLNDWQ